MRGAHNITPTPNRVNPPQGDRVQKDRLRPLCSAENHDIAQGQCFLRKVSSAMTVPCAFSSPSGAVAAGAAPGRLGFASDFGNALGAGVTAPGFAAALASPVPGRSTC